MLPRSKKVISEKNRTENLGQVGYRSLDKILQGPVCDTVWARSLAELETPDGFLSLFRVC